MNEIARAMLRLRCFQTLVEFKNKDEPLTMDQIQKLADNLFDWCLKEKAEK